ncbi:hypothetical protein [Desertivirga brevis]|uniref:hypothetical protein n=1 Tax=Desertivirga brevis TaxID=2810310 RepID=UPI001A962C4F|nr:hypothetical protein [Pedobacter sp. SYSU D00873]
MFKFTATIEIIGINPFVFVPDDILNSIFEQAGKSKGPSGVLPAAPTFTFENYFAQT